MRRSLALLLAITLVLAVWGVGPAQLVSTTASVAMRATATVATVSEPTESPSSPTVTSTSPPTTATSVPTAPPPTAVARVEDAPTSTPDPTATLSPTPNPGKAVVRPTRTPVPKPTSTPSPVPLVTFYTYSPAYSDVNVRAEPTTKSPVVLRLPYAASVQAIPAPVTNVGGESWHEVRHEGEKGYVLSSLLRLQKPGPSPTPTPIPTATSTPRPASVGAPNPKPHTAGGGDTWTLTAVGDIMLGRSVLDRMHAYGDYTHPYHKTAEILRAADLTVANLELPLSDNVAPPTDPHTMTFVAPTEAATGLKWAGIDAVSLANNHTTNFGTSPMLDTMVALDRYGIGHFGAGGNMQQAYSARIFNVKGTRVALLGFDAVVMWGWTDPSGPGLATAWEGPVRDAILRARSQADVVIPFFHWGVEYTSVPNQFQRHMAHVSVDAGADLVLGAHPHWVQQVEEYNGKLIAYSLGNFIFDQGWSRETMQGVMGTFTFQGSTLLDTHWMPVVIEDWNQPRIATGADYYAVLQRMGVSE